MQAELFVIRLSRHSGLAGLAGIPLASDMLRCMPEFFNGKDVVVRTRVVRPLLHFTKSDLQQVWWCLARFHRENLKFLKENMDQVCLVCFSRLYFVNKCVHRSTCDFLF